jgi:hypothetical protein
MSSQNPQTDSPLRHLPVELFKKVTAHLTTKDFCALRSTCKLVEYRTNNIFASAFFRQKQFMVTTPSLTALNDISQHPVFSQSLRRFCLGTNSYASTRHIPETEDQRRAWEEGSADQGVLINTGLWRGMLVDAFRTLPNLKVLDLRDFNSETRYRDGRGALWRSCGEVTVFEKTDTYLNMVNRHDSRSDILYQNLILAAAEAGLEPVTLEIILKTSGLTSLGIRPIAPMLPVLRGLSTVHIDINGDAFGGKLYGLMAFLTSIPQVTWLRLNLKFVGASQDIVEWMAAPCVASADGDEDDNSALALAPANRDIPPPAFAHLSRLELGWFCTKPAALEALLDKLSPTLTSLTLWRMALENDVPGSKANLWAQFLERRSASNSILKDVTLGSLTQREHGDHRTLEVSLGGTNKIRVRNYRAPDPGQDDEWIKLAKRITVVRPPAYGERIVGFSQR